MKYILVIFLAWMCCAAGPQVIYGVDNRKNLYDVTDPQIVAWADSTVGLFDEKNLTLDKNGSYQIKLSRYGEYFKLCPLEHFFSEPIGPDCSGFLAKQDIVVTAGHCMPKVCDGTKFVFGFALKSPDDPLGTVPSSDVYSCKSVIHHVETDDDADFAVIQLDRPVTGHKPLALRTNGAPLRGDPLVLIGHPSGLPTKVADGGIVRKVSEKLLQASTDSYEGNSGSAVINPRTGEVEGVLIRGEEDFEKMGDCYVSKICDGPFCAGEDVTLISQVLPYIPNSAISGK